VNERGRVKGWRARKWLAEHAARGAVLVSDATAATGSGALHTGSGRANVDLGAAGVADRWADLAVATWSTEWNYGSGWDRPLLDAYSIEPDPELIAYHRLLWGLAS
jgi:kanamycin kinase